MLELDQDIPAIALAPELPKLGESVTAIGDRLGKHQTRTEGKVLSAEPNRPIKVSLDLLNSGNSGGPVVNGKGEMIGIARAVSEKDGVLVPTAIVQEYLLDKL